MCNVENLLSGNSDAMEPASAGAVEVTRTDGGVLLRVDPGPPAMRISEWGWADFVAAVAAGEFDTTLHSGNTFRTSDVAPVSADVVEVTRADGGVLLRVVPGASAVHISSQVWSAFLAGVYRGVFNDTLPSAEEAFASLDASA